MNYLNYWSPDLTCVSLDSRRPRILLCRMRKAAADPVEDTDAVLWAKLCGSMTTLSLATSNLASGSFILFLRFFTYIQTQTTTVMSTIITAAPAPNRPISSDVNKGGCDGSCFGAGVRVLTIVETTGEPEKNITTNLLEADTSSIQRASQ